MQSLSGWWVYVASSQAAIIFGVTAILILFRFCLTDQQDAMTKSQRAIGVFALGASFYTFGVLVISQLMVNGPNIDVLVRDGFGNERLGYLLLLIVAEQAIRLHLMLRPTPA